jgi:hypothetical protein
MWIEHDKNCPIVRHNGPLLDAFYQREIRRARRRRIFRTANLLLLFVVYTAVVLTLAWYAFKGAPR